MFDRYQLTVATGVIISGSIVLAFFEPESRTVSGEADSSTRLAVLELFTSEGCSSCPPADRLLQRISQQSDRIKGKVIVLSWHVDYWNYLGWSDPFSSKTATQRQRRYARRLGTSVFTPQLVVNGLESAVGSRSAEVTEAFNKGQKPRESSVQASIEKVERDSVLVRVRHQKVPTGSTILACLVQKSGQVDVRRGENSGRTLGHVNIVRSVWFGKANAESGKLNVELELPGNLAVENAGIVVLIQDRESDAILGATEVELKSSPVNRESIASKRPLWTPGFSSGI